MYDLNYIDFYKTRITYLKKSLKPLILCIVIQILFYICLFLNYIAFFKSFKVVVIVFFFEWIAVWYIFSIIFTLPFKFIYKYICKYLFIYWHPDNIKMKIEKYSFIWLFVLSIIFLGIGIALYVFMGVITLEIIDIDITYFQISIVICIFLFLFNVYLIFYTLYNIYKEKQKIKYETYKESELKVYEKDLSKFLKVSFTKTEEVKVFSPIFIIETKHNEVFASKLNFKLPPKCLSVNPNLASTIIILFKGYDPNIRGHRAYYTEILNYDNKRELINYGGIEYISPYYDTDLSRESYDLRLSEEKSDEEFIFFIMNYRFRQFKFLDYPSDHIKKIKEKIESDKLQF